MKRIREFLGINGWKSMQIFCLLIGLSVMWYAPLLFALTGDELPEMQMEYNMMVSAEQIPHTVSTQTTNDVGLLVLTRYRDVIHIALLPNEDVNEVWCEVIDEVEWRKKLDEIDDNKFFGRIRTNADYVSVSCQVEGGVINVYSIYAKNVTEYPFGMRDYVFTTLVNDLDRYWNPTGYGFAGLPPMIPY